MAQALSDADDRVAKTTNLEDSSWSPGRIGLLGSGSWATALAKILLQNADEINWYFRFKDTVKQFIQEGHNPGYLSSVNFETDRINFYTDVEELIENSDTIILITPSPYVRNLLSKIKKANTEGKFFLNAIKGIVPEDNVLISDYLHDNLKIPVDYIGAIGGPCHAEEVAMDRLSYLTIACSDKQKAEQLKNCVASKNIRCSINTDVVGVEYASVLKNVYAIASGICSGMKYGDNFQAVLISNAVREMKDFVDMVQKEEREIADSVYLGDLLVTAYSRFSRNRTFGSMIGKGYSVKQAQLEMEMVAEGYYGAKCVHEVSKRFKANLPIMEAVYKILYEKVSPKEAIADLTKQFI